MYGTSPGRPNGIPRDRVSGHRAIRSFAGQRSPRLGTTLRRVSDDHVTGRSRRSAEAHPVERAARRPRSTDPQELGFTPRKPVPWLAPLLLISTGLRTLLAMLFGAYLDKRELQNALPAT